MTPTVGGFHPMDMTSSLIGKWLRLIREREDLVLIERAGQVLKAKQENKTGVILHLQGPEAVADDLDLIDVVKRLGVGIIQLTYILRTGSVMAVRHLTKVSNHLEKRSSTVVIKQR